AAGADGKVRRQLAYGTDAFGEPRERTVYAADFVVDLVRAIQRHDDFISPFYNKRGIGFQQHPGTQYRGAHAAPAQHRGEPKQVRVHQRLSAREHHPFDAEPLDIRQMPLQFGGADLTRIGDLPDVAHDAAAVAAVVRLKYQDGQALQEGLHGRILLPARRRSLPRCFAASRRKPRMSASTSTGGRFSTCNSWKRRRMEAGSWRARSGEIRRMPPATT